MKSQKMWLMELSMVTMALFSPTDRQAQERLLRSLVVLNDTLTVELSHVLFHTSLRILESIHRASLRSISATLKFTMAMAMTC